MAPALGVFYLRDFDDEGLLISVKSFSSIIYLLSDVSMQIFLRVYGFFSKKEIFRHRAIFLRRISFLEGIARKIPRVLGSP